MLKLMLYVVCEKHLINILNHKCDIMSSSNNNVTMFDVITHKIILF